MEAEASGANHADADRRLQNPTPRWLSLKN